MSRHTTLWVGTYPVAGFGTPSGAGEGVWRVSVDPRTGGLGTAEQVVACPAPSFVAVHPVHGVLYAASETTPGLVSAFRPTAAGPVHLGTVASGGASPCHLAFSPRGDALYVSHYVTGTVTALPLRPDGSLQESAVGTGGATGAVESGEDPDAPASHAHSTTVMPGGTHVVGCDTGTDTLWRYTVAADGTLAADGVAARLPAGTGPRHLVVGPDGTMHVTGEPSGTVSTLAWDRRRAEATFVGAVRVGGDGSTGPCLPAHLVRDGGLLHVSVRGPDTIETFTVEHHGRLRQRARTSTAGSWPRHFAVVGRVLVVANQTSDRLSSFVRDGDGWAARDAVALPAPACVTPTPDGRSAP